MPPFEKYQAVKKAYAAGANKENAQAMGKYMRNLFPFYGLKTPGIIQALFKGRD
ncbi:hypothetical protein EFR21_04195 [Lactobacillus delbrueckii subsp. bulgaricus]|nr:hypothetical protein [Lactobacillus delbrueckii subsp. bulgaricus]MCT3471177.1 hypothetical protein [Lactobacillus delbrueckii subsp. bulgaricus]